MLRKETHTGSISAQAQQDLVSEGIENYELPRTIVQKLAKSAIPENAKLQKETVSSLQKGSTVFINYLAATAHDVALSKQHKSISASDVLKALEMIEFGDLVGMLQDELQVYRDLAKTDKSKKGSANINVLHKGKSASATVVASSKTKGKGKEKAVVDNMPPPLTTVPLGGAATTSSSGALRSIPTGVMDADADEEMADPAHEVGGEDVMDEEEGEDVMDEDEVEDEEGEEDAALEDPMAMEEEELRKDAKGLEEPPSALDAHVD